MVLAHAMEGTVWGEPYTRILAKKMHNYAWIYIYISGSICYIACITCDVCGSHCLTSFICFGSLLVRVRRGDPSRWLRWHCHGAHEVALPGGPGHDERRRR